MTALLATTLKLLTGGTKQYFLCRDNETVQMMPNGNTKCNSDQCNQFGLFLKDRGDKCSYKSDLNISCTCANLINII